MKNRIKDLRGERNWSQETLGEMVGVSRQAIIAIEKGKHDPSLNLAFDLAGVFGLRIEEVFIKGHK